MGDNIFDKIYALRINFMDIYYDEKSIIYNIKKNLYKYDGYQTDEELNQVIIDFYKSYDIDITTIDLDSLKVVNQPEPFENLLNLINSTFIPLNTPTDNNLSTESAYDNESISIDYNNSSTNQQNDDEEQANTDDEEHDDSDDEEHDDSDDEEHDDSDDENNEEHNDPDDENNEEFYNPVTNNPLLSNNNIYTFNSNQNISADQFLNVINIFSDIMNSVDTNNYNPNEYEDVVVTLDDKDYDKLQTIKYSDLNNKEDDDEDKKCSICLVEFENDDMLIKLPCNHYFHKGCIEEWLKEYDYKCPVCRHECGKTKSNFSQPNSEE